MCTPSGGKDTGNSKIGFVIIALRHLLLYNMKAKKSSTNYRGRMLVCVSSSELEEKV